MIVKEKNGSLTINCQGEATMSTRSYGMVGKSYKTASEAFKDASYAYSIEPPRKEEYSPIWSLLWVLTVLGIVAYLGFTRF